MIPFEQDSVFSRIQEFMATGALSAFGGVAAYLYGQTRQGQRFSFAPFLINSFLAFFVGHVMGSFMPKDMPGRDGVLLMAGFCSFPILALLEIYFMAWVAKRGMTLGGLEQQDVEKARQDLEQLKSNDKEQQK